MKKLYAVELKGDAKLASLWGISLEEATKLRKAVEKTAPIVPAWVRLC